MALDKLCLFPHMFPYHHPTHRVQIKSDEAQRFLAHRSLPNCSCYPVKGFLDAKKESFPLPQKTTGSIHGATLICLCRAPGWGSEGMHSVCWVDGEAGAHHLPNPHTQSPLPAPTPSQRGQKPGFTAGALLLLGMAGVEGSLSFNVSFCTRL